MKKEERHQIKRNDLATILEMGSDFVADHFKGVLAGAIAVVVIVLAVAGVRGWWSARQAAQARLLGAIVETANASITATIEDLSAARPGVASFTSREERDRKVLEMADALIARGGTVTLEAGALVYRGIALADLGRPDEADKALQQAVDLRPGGLFGPLARLRLARLREGLGKPAEALPLFQAIADDRTGVIPPEEGILGMARCQEALGKQDEAERLYERLATEFPDSEYAGEARSRSGAAS